MTKAMFLQRLYCVPLIVLSFAAGLVSAQEATAVRSLRLDVFVRSDRPSAEQTERYLDALKKNTRGLEVHVHDLLLDRDQLKRFYELSERAGREKPVLPAFAMCDRMYFGFVDAETTGPKIDDLRTANLYTRTTCPKCRKLKAFLPTLQARWPAVRFQIHDVDRSAANRARWEELCRAAKTVPGLPTIEFARRIIVGYQGDDVTGAQLDQLIEQVSGTGPALALQSPSSHRHGTADGRSMSVVALLLPVGTLTADPPSDLLELPEEASVEEIGSGEAPVKVLIDDETIDVPLLGRLNPSELGMPVFTVAVGLVDGFNPCAMWVLVFLLSVLVNIKDRRKIMLIAGTFVFVSGAAYFAFMAAWLNVFLLVGIKRPVQIALGVLALTIGIINVKDFFAFKKGVSLSIPESQKPGLYRRVREIVSAKYLTAALAGAVALAVVVNMIELLCTAGLPALYTQVLTMQDYPAWKNYLYLAIYIVAYMLDDSLLVGVVLVTLSHRKLQEREGRWLKLLSGSVILVLGLVMLFRPAWLQLGA